MQDVQSVDLCQLNSPDKNEQFNTSKNLDRINTAVVSVPGLSCSPDPSIIFVHSSPSTVGLGTNWL